MMSDRVWRQPHWVGDLTVKFRLDVRDAKGKVRVELIKAGVVNRAEIDLADGMATLTHGGRVVGEPTPSGISGPGTHALSFANVDDRLTLRVDGRLPFGEGRTTELQPGEPIAPTAADLSPAAVASQGADASVSGLVLTRDVYYSLDPSESDYRTFRQGDPTPSEPGAFFDWLGDPRNFAQFEQLSFKEYAITPGHYMMLGDNSPASRDGRQWKLYDQIRPGAGRRKAGTARAERAMRCPNRS